MLTAFKGSNLNHVVNVNPLSYGHFAKGGSTIAYKLKWWVIFFYLLFLGTRISRRMMINLGIKENICFTLSSVLNFAIAVFLTEPFTPGKLKNTSGPDLFGICFKTFINFFEWLGWNDEKLINNSFWSIYWKLVFQSYC